MIAHTAHIQWTVSLISKCKLAFELKPQQKQIRFITIPDKD